MAHLTNSTPTKFSFGDVLQFFFVAESESVSAMLTMYAAWSTKYGQSRFRRLWQFEFRTRLYTHCRTKVFTLPLHPKKTLLCSDGYVIL